eukprot:gene3400-7279_t
MRVGLCLAMVLMPMDVNAASGFTFEGGTWDYVDCYNGFYTHLGIHEEAAFLNENLHYFHNGKYYISYATYDDYLSTAVGWVISAKSPKNADALFGYSAEEVFGHSMAFNTPTMFPPSGQKWDIGEGDDDWNDDRDGETTAETPTTSTATTNATQTQTTQTATSSTTTTPPILPTSLATTFATPSPTTHVAFVDTTPATTRTDALETTAVHTKKDIASPSDTATPTTTTTTAASTGAATGKIPAVSKRIPAIPATNQTTGTTNSSTNNSTNLTNSSAIEAIQHTKTATTTVVVALVAVFLLVVLVAAGGRYTSKKRSNAAAMQQQHQQQRVTNEAYVGPAVQRTPNVLYAPYNPNKRNVPLTPNILYSGAGTVYAVATDGAGGDRNNHYDLGPGGNRGKGADRNNHYDLGPGGRGATLRRGGGSAAAASIVYAIPFESGDGGPSTLRGASTSIVYATPLDSMGEEGGVLKRHSTKRQQQRTTAPPDNRPSAQQHDQQQHTRGSLRIAVNEVYGSEA